MSALALPATPRRLLLALALYAVALAALAWPLDLADYRAVFSEQGPFERLSPVFWVGVALACAVQAAPLADGRGRGRNLVVLAGIALLLSLCEDEWHYALAGGNVLKLKFYSQNPASFEVKLIAAAVVLVGLVVVLRGLWLAVSTLRHRAAWRAPWVWTLAIGGIAMVLTKLLDRSIGLAREWFAITLPEQAGRLIGAWEEGFECALPLIFALALWQWRRGVNAATPIDARVSRWAAQR
jgi:cytochrome bd-type quinol oxidase subunit 2